MYFFLVFLITLLLTLFLYKLKMKWAKWTPVMIFLLATIILVIKIMLFPAPEMAVLGEIVYAMVFATMTIASFIGGVIIHFWKRKQS